MLVIDASLFVEWCIAPGEGELGTLLSDELCAPPLMWSEARSALHERVWRRELGVEEADRARARLEGADVKLRALPALPIGLGGSPTTSAGRKPMTPSTWRWPRCSAAGS